MLWTQRNCSSLTHRSELFRYIIWNIRPVRAYCRVNDWLQSLGSLSTHALLIMLSLTNFSPTNIWDKKLFVSVPAEVLTFNIAELSTGILLKTMLVILSSSSMFFGSHLIWMFLSIRGYHLMSSKTLTVKDLEVFLLECLICLKINFLLL